MKQLRLSITKDNHKFNLRLLPFREIASYYEFCGDYELSILFGKNHSKKPYVKYKNLWYSGAISSRVNWHITLNDTSIMRLAIMRNSRLFVKGCIPSTYEAEQIDEYIVESDPPLNECIELHKECICYNKKQYDLIANKNQFEEELLEVILDEYSYYQEVYGGKKEFFEECSEYFSNFLLAEQECPRISNIITADDILKLKPECFEGLKIKDMTDFINFAIDTVAEDFEDFISIYYSREILYDAIIDEAIQNINDRQQAQFKKKYAKNSNIKKLLGDKITILNDLNPLFQEIHYLILIDKINSTKTLVTKADELIQKCLAFEHLCENFKKCNYEKEVNLDTEKEKLFSDYERGLTQLSEEELMEYHAYKVIIPHYYLYLYNKKRTKLKPSIEKLNDYFNFAKKTIELLIENEIVINQGNTLKYNDCGNVNKYIKDIETLLIP